MSTAQSWALIGGLLAILVAMSGLVLALVHAEFASLRNEMIACFESLERVFHERRGE